ncbi:hypothetical protein TIFTF001_024818 [Ficus carica]|uniref:Uncharacterized protein n=1 Tax=Ficus carica TaxID=3494 RepID=A0AA88AYB0_FICCA|nr:hypothetical protein TIFTF001_024818 [Ficus carica]
MRTRRWRRRASSSTAGMTRNAGGHDDEISNENRCERLTETREEHRRKIMTKNGVKSRGNHRKNRKEIAATGALVKVRLQREWTSGLLVLVSSTAAGYFVFSGEAGFVFSDEAGFGLGWF